MIKSGNLKSGDKLPTEQQMCLAFGISRPPLREALKALTLIGVLKSRQGGRYLVTDLTPLANDGYAFEEDPVGFRLLDLEYHQAINQGANNSILATLSEGLYNVAIDARRLASSKAGVIAISVQQHCDVARAIEAGDAEQAMQAYQQHLQHVLDTTLSALDELPGNS